MKQHNFRVTLLLAVGVSCLLAVALAAQGSGKKEYSFRGKVEKVDAKARTLSVNGEKVEGWMDAMTMLYRVSNADVLKKLKAGDQIAAKVYEGDTSTLYDVRVVPPADATARPK